MDNELCLQDQFFAPLAAVLPECRQQRGCADISDEQFLWLGVTRVLSEARSGRGFLQQLSGQMEDAPKLRTFFEMLKSERRLALLREASAKVASRLPAAVELPQELCGCQLFAGDGHWHAAASHDKALDDRVWATGHVYGLNLRTRAMHHLALTEGKKEHDIHVLQRLGAEAFGMQRKKQQRTIWIWDRAGLDFGLWRKWKQTSGIYFVSRTRENRAFSVMSILPFDMNDPDNQGVFSDTRVMTEDRVELRWVNYVDPLTGSMLEFVTNLFDVPPGIIAWLYKQRWHIEKVFDQFKNKLFEAKAWATSATAKNIQAEFLCLTHNLLQLFEQYLEQQGIRNEAELARQKKRLADQVREVKRLKRAWSSLLNRFIPPLQRSIKLLRWIRVHWFASTPLTSILPHLRTLYARL